MGVDGGELIKLSIKKWNRNWSTLSNRSAFVRNAIENLGI